MLYIMGGHFISHYWEEDSFFDFVNKVNTDYIITNDINDLI